MDDEDKKPYTDKAEKAKEDYAVRFPSRLLQE